MQAVYNIEIPENETLQNIKKILNSWTDMNVNANNTPNYTRNLIDVLNDLDASPEVIANLEQYHDSQVYITRMGDFEVSRDNVLETGLTFKIVDFPQKIPVEIPKKVSYPTFAELIREDKIDPEMETYFVESWHDGFGEGQSLSEYLGMTDIEYSAFVKGDDYISLIKQQQ